MVDKGFATVEMHLMGRSEVIMKKAESEGQIISNHPGRHVSAQEIKLK